MNFLWIIFLSAATWPLIVSGRNTRKEEAVFEWKLLEFDFPTVRDRQRAMANGNLVPGNAVPIDVQPHYYSNGLVRMFTTIPRFTTGIPFTLATVNSAGRNGPLLQAYPSYDWHNTHGANCDGITSAFRVAINECNQMWVIDSGIIGGVQLCPPQLLLFDLNSDSLVHRYRFNTNVYTPSASLLITPLVRVSDPPPRGRCQRTTVYIADVTHHGLIVYDQQLNESWRVENRFMYPDPDYGMHTIAGENFNLMDGIFALSADSTQLYFHPLASVSEYSVPLNVLNNRQNWLEDSEAMPTQFRKVGERASECAQQAMDSRKNLYCVTFNPIKLISWKTGSQYGGMNLKEIPTNSSLLQFVSGMKVVSNLEGKDELWMMSNRFQKISAGTMNPNEVNFRIVRRQLDDLQEGSAGPTGNNIVNFGNFAHHGISGGYGAYGAGAGYGGNKEVNNRLIFH